MLISIITVCYNDLNGLQKTAQSVFEQGYENIQYIVIDGNSDDGTKLYLKEISGKLDYWISEADKGIYDAMNKGIDQCKGEYLLFLNAGDSLVNSNVLSKFVDNQPEDDIVYGDTLLVHDNGKEEYKRMPDELLGFNMLERTLNHQSTFLKRGLFSDQKYDLSYKMLADWAFYNRQLLVNKASFKHIDVTIARYDMMGYSSNPKNKAIMRADRIKFYKEHIELIEPMLRTEYHQLKSKYDILNKWKWVKLGRSLVKLKKKIFG